MSKGWARPLDNGQYRVYDKPTVGLLLDDRKHETELGAANTLP
jgi:hypothetical protein